MNHGKLLVSVSIAVVTLASGICLFTGCNLTGNSKPQLEFYSELMQGNVSIAVVNEGDAQLNLIIHQDFARSGYPLRIDVEITNNSGHYLPDGPGELWLELDATDPLGRTFRIPVYPKGFEGEEYTISDAEALAYLDIGDVTDLDGFSGLARDSGIAEGARIFRSPSIAPDGQMTLCPDYAGDNSVVDYRIAPGQTDTETYVWNVVDGFSYGRLEVAATLYYRPLPASIGEFFELPEADYAPVVVAAQQQLMDIVDWGN